MIDCKNCFYRENPLEFLLCDEHKTIGRPINRKYDLISVGSDNDKRNIFGNIKYDNLYKDCTTPVRIAELNKQVFKLDVLSGRTMSTDLGWGHWDAKVTKRSDIEMPEFFREQIHDIRKYDLQPWETQKKIDALRNPDRALASWDFNETFDIKGNFEEEYDMDVVKEIISLFSKVKKVKRIG